MDTITPALRERLEITSRRLLTHALEHALGDAQSETDALQTVINMQAALELLSKLRVLHRQGWRAIVDGKFHSQPERDVLEAIRRGEIKTVAYWQSKEVMSQDLYLEDEDKRLLSDFQRHRNQIMHLGLVEVPKDVLNEAIWFLVRIIHQLDWRSPRRDYFENSMQEYIGVSLYAKLMGHSAYVSEAIDRAYSLAPHHVRYCIECGNEAMLENEVDDLSCCVCGFQAPAHSIGFVDCVACRARDAVAYDRLNIGAEDQPGLCARCRIRTTVSKCRKCTRGIYANGGRCPFCETDRAQT